MEISLEGMDFLSKSIPILLSYHFLFFLLLIFRIFEFEWGRVGQIREWFCDGFNPIICQAH